MRRRSLVPLLALTLAGCALRSDVNRLERQLTEERRLSARRDSLATVNAAQVARMLQAVQDSLAAQSLALARLRGDVRGELFNIQQQLVAVQELTGQSQQRLTELRADLAQRVQQPPDTARSAAGAPGAAASDPSATELLDLSIAQLRRGSPGTARAGFAEFLRRYADHPRAVDAVYFTGEAWEADQRPDSAAAAYREVARRWAQSPRAARAHYKLGLLALAAGRTTDARQAFERVVSQFPSSDEAAQARERLRTLPPR